MALSDTAASASAPLLLLTFVAVSIAPRTVSHLLVQPAPAAMATRRHNAATAAVASPSPSPQPRTDTAPPPAPVVPRYERGHTRSGKLNANDWFTIYYWTLCASALIGLGVWFFFFASPYASHIAYDPMRSLPELVRNDVTKWYQVHGAAAPVAATSSTSASTTNPMDDLLDFLLRFQHAGFFTPEGAGKVDFEHYVNALTTGWITGVFEGITLDEAALQAVEKEQQGVGSIPGGSRRLKEQLAKVVSPITSQLFDGDVAAHAAGEVSGDSDSEAHGVRWSHLTEEQQNWVMEGLSHCHTSPCRLAKMQLMTLWHDRLALFPTHPKKDQWQLLTSLFHPDTHPAAEDRLEDSPATVDTLAQLWYRFFGSGDEKYIKRVAELARITGAPAYQVEKDKEIREWAASKHKRAVAEREERIRVAQAEAKKTGVPAPVEPPVKASRSLPASPTSELHAHFFNSLLFYSNQHPAVIRVVRAELAAHPQDPVLKRLMSAPPFNAEDNNAASKKKQL